MWKGTSFFDKKIEKIKSHGTLLLRTLPLEGKLSPKVTDEVGTLQAALGLRMVRSPSARFPSRGSCQP